MSKLRKWMMKEERENSTGSVDTSAIKLFGKTIAVSGADSGSGSAKGASVSASLDDVAEAEASQAGSEEVDGASTQSEADDMGSACIETGSKVGMASKVETASKVDVDTDIESKVEAAVSEFEVETEAASDASPVEKEKDVSVEAQVSVVVAPAGPQQHITCQDNKAGASTQQQQSSAQEKQRALTVEEKKEQCLRKPDKLIPCPRCDSLDTKFCYYNNYNINQPRHFCKSCQRYWTAGGTLRNVLVGAGRRKNKYGTSQMKQDVCESSGVTSVRMDHHEPAQQPMLPCSPYSSPVALGKVPPMNLPHCSPRGGSESMAGSSVTSCGNKDNGSPGMNASGYGGLKTQKVFSSASAFKATGSEMSSDSVSKLRQRTRTETSDSKADCGSSMSTSPTAETARENTYVLSARVPPQQAEAQAVWSKSTAPMGFFNGAWPYGYNIGWSGAGPMPGAPSLCSPQSAAMGSGTPPTSAQAWTAPPANVWTGMWASGMPPAAIPGMSAMPTFGWNMCQGGWTLPWRPVPAVAVQPSQPENCSSMKKRSAYSTPAPEDRGHKMARVGSPEQVVA